MSGSFIVIGENIHASRILLRKGKRFAEREGRGGVVFTTIEGEEGFLPVTEWMTAGKEFQQGRVKHIALAVREAMRGAPEGEEYLRRVIRDQERAGAHFLDVNVDEISLRPAEQREAMVWLVGFVREHSQLPVSVDSSDVQSIAAGLRAAGGNGARPMLNSASLERIDALELAVEHGARVIVTSSGAEGMPSDAGERIDNASRMVEAALAGGLAEGDIYVDPLVFPISVDGSYGLHVLDAIRGLRERFGSGIHITGGLSNVSFGIPARKLMNAAFINLATEAGADSGIIDPVMNPVAEVWAADRESPGYRLACDTLLGRDEFCMNYLKAWRAGELT